MAWLDVSQRDGKRMIPNYRDTSLERTSNPNEEDFVPSVLIHGRGPSQRAGHTATAVQRTIFIFGGSGKFACPWVFAHGLTLVL